MTGTFKERFFWDALFGVPYPEVLLFLPALPFAAIAMLFAGRKSAPAYRSSSRSPRSSLSGRAFERVRGTTYRNSSILQPR